MNDYFKCCIAIHLSVFSCKEGMGKHQYNGWTETNAAEGFANHRICPLLYDPPMVGVILYHISNDGGMELLLFFILKKLQKRNWFGGGQLGFKYLWGLNSVEKNTRLSTQCVYYTCSGIK